MTGSPFSQVIQQEYLERKRNHPLYSERAFARDLQLSPGFLKLFFQGKKNMSIERAIRICRRLNWSELKIELALGLLQKNKLQRQLSKGSHAKNLLNSRRELHLQEFSLLSDWFYFAIIELCDLFPKGLRPSRIKEQLGLSETEIQFATDRLKSHGLISEKNLKFFKMKKDYGISPQASEVIRKYHRQIMKKALTSIDTQDFSQKENLALTLSFDSNKIAEAKALIEKFVNDFNSHFESGNKNSVYQLAVSFFKLNKGD